MKNSVVIALFLLVILTACAPKVKLDQEKEASTAETKEAPGDVMEKKETVTVMLKPAFKIVQDFAKKSPPSVNGTVKNIGNGTGDVKITAQVYYAKVIASERTQTIENIEPEEEVKFGIPFDTTVQWTSYGIVAETIE